MKKPFKKTPPGSYSSIPPLFQTTKPRLFWGPSDDKLVRLKNFRPTKLELPLLLGKVFFQASYPHCLECQEVSIPCGEFRHVAPKKPIPKPQSFSKVESQSSWKKSNPKVSNLGLLVANPGKYPKSRMFFAMGYFKLNPAKHQNPRHGSKNLFPIIPSFFFLVSCTRTATFPHSF